MGLPEWGGPGAFQLREMLRAVEKSGWPGICGLSSEGEEGERDGVEGWGRLRGVNVGWLERVLAHYECHQEGANREAKGKSKLKETPHAHTAE